MTAPAPTLQLSIATDQPESRIPREIYGHFAEHLGRCIYEGIWVGPDSPISNTRGLRNDVLEALQKLSIPVLRWPGGCFADAYHWRDGIGSRESRPRRLDVIWGNVIETNHFGTHEFMDLVELLGCKAYIAGNVGSGTVQEMSDWVHYLTADADTDLVRERRANGRDKPWHIDYFGVGNENWVCGGNMRPEYYADEYRRYNNFIRPHYLRPKIHRIACGPNQDDFKWTETLMERAGEFMDGLSLHYYCLPTDDWQDKGEATGFDESDWFGMFKKTWRMDDLIQKHSAIMDRHDPDKRVALIVDEWGAWYNVEAGTHSRHLYQQNTLRDALLAALHLHIFHRRRERVRMANLAQTINVLQAMILTDGARMLRTPSYHIFEMFKVHQDALHLPINLGRVPDYTFDGATLPALDVSASQAADGSVHLSIINIDPHQPHTVEVTLPGGLCEGKTLSGRLLTAEAMDARNTFEQPDAITPCDITPATFSSAGQITLKLPPKSVALYSLP